MLSTFLVPLALGIALRQSPDTTRPTNHERTLSSWIHQALERHPQSEAARATAEAGRAEAAAGGFWMPPTTQIEARSDGSIDLSLTQMVPWPGKTAAQAKVREAKARMGESDSAERGRKLALSVREAAWMEWMALEKAKLLAARESLSVRVAEAAARSQAQGMATPSEAWLARAAVRQAGAAAERARAEAQAATSMRESWTGRAGPLVPAAATAPDWTDSVLFEGIGRRPDVAAMRREAEMENAMGESMESTLKPDLMVGAMAMRMSSGMPGWGAMAGITLPFVPWARGMAVGQAASARARGRGALSRATAMEAMARSEIVEHASKARAAWKALRELDALGLPEQERAVADARARYAQGREMLSMLLSMQEMVLMARMDAIMLRGEYEIERSRLLSAAGLEPTLGAGLP